MRSSSRVLLLFLLIAAIMGSVAHWQAASAQDLLRAAMAYPTGDRFTSTVLVEKTGPSQIRVGESFDYEVKITNLTSLLLDEVVVFERLAQDFRFTSSSPRSLSMAPSVPATAVVRPTRVQPATPPSVSPEGFVISLGAFSTAAQAEKLRETAVGYNFPAEVVMIQGSSGQKMLHNVIVSGFSTSAEAMVVRNQLVALDEFDEALVTRYERLNVVSAATTAPAQPMGVETTTPVQPALAGNQLRWRLGTLGPRESKTIQISGSASSINPLTNCTTVTYQPFVCLTFQATQPSIDLVKQAPAEVLLCDSIPLKLIVTNTGSSELHGVRIDDPLPAGWTTLDGRTTFQVDVGTLAAGQSREFSTAVKASRTGNYTNRAVVVTDEGVTAESATTTRVREPVLSITKTGPARTFLGRQVDYAITITNNGDAPAADTVLTDMIPSGMTFSTASMGGDFDGFKVTWDLGTLQPQESKRVSLAVHADQFGSFRNTASARAVCASPVSAHATTEVAGIPAILLEVVDVEDPIQVGDQETYVITVTNQGSAVDTNIRISCALESNMQYISSSGATVGSGQGSIVTFAPLPSLAPKAKATWRVVVKAQGAGDTRFKVTMNSDELQRPVEETEATNLYQ